MQFGAIFSAVGACKKAVDFVKDVQKVPEDAIFLWKLVDSLEAPVMLAVQLMGREATLPFVSSVLDLTHDVLFACEVLLVRADPEGRPYEPDSWQAWWSQVPSRTKDDLSRMKLLPRVTSRLSDTAAALQAALLTTQMRVLSMGPQALVGSHPLRAEDALSSYEGARRVLHLFEMGRLPESSATYQLWVGRVSEKGRVLSFNAVVLLRRNSSGGYELVVVEGADVDSVRESHPPSALSGRLEVEYTTNITPPKKKSKTPNVQPIAVVPSAHLASSRVSIMPNIINITVSASKAEVATEDADDGDLRAVSSRAVVLELEFQPCTSAGQFTFFPLGRETYTKITVERALWILCAIRALGRANPQGAVDSVVPIFDDNASAFDWFTRQLS